VNFAKLSGDILNQLPMKPTFVVVLLFCFAFVKAQPYLGISLDVGNAIKTDSKAGHLLKSEVAPSGSVIFLNQEEINKNWVLQYGVNAGVLGTILQNLTVDSLMTSYDRNLYSRFGNYSSEYVGAQLSIGRRLNLGKKSISFFTGGGVTYYLQSRDQGGTGSCDDLRCIESFRYELFRKDEKIKGFVESSLQTNLKPWLLVGLRYRFHFSPALEGKYSFDHIDNPIHGRLLVTQRSFGFFFLMKLNQKLYDHSEVALRPIKL
jgi:hypothetical protein